MKRWPTVGLLGAALFFFAASILTASTASAQAPQARVQSSAGADAVADRTRPATTTVSGTTGLWHVPTSEVLPARKWAVSFYRTNIDDGQGFVDVSTFPATVAVGLGDRAELFGSWSLITRLDRDTRPLFFNGATGTSTSGTGGGILLDYPRFLNGWTGNARGDLWLGGKINLLASSTSPLGAALRATVKIPAGDDGAGTSSGKADVQIDGIVSSYNPMVEVSGYGGVVIRGNPDGFTLTNGVRWGIGAAFPQRYNLGFRITAELFGEKYFDDMITAPAGLTGSDGSVVPVSTRIKSPAVAALGLTWQAPNGVFVGAAGSWNFAMKNRENAGFPNTPKDDKGLQVRIGFHPGARDRRAPAPLPSAPPPPSPAPVAVAPPAPENRPPMVTAVCNPCTVEVGRSATVTADAQDPDGDPLTYEWTASAGSLASPTSRQSTWTAPMQEGSVPLTVTVDDGRGGTARAGVSIQVSRPTAQQFTFEDVHFEFDRFNLRQDALSLLDEAVTALRADPTLQLEIEGHTCNIGTAEYNLALGDRRARAVLDYLTSRDISGDRLRTVSYGEERPRYDNSREETRRLNRRAAMVVRLQ